MIKIIKEGYRQLVSFHDDKYKQIIYREIVYPINEEFEDVYQYFLNSISLNTILCINEKKRCFYLTEDKKENSKSSKIEKYWIDAEIYLIDYLKNDIHNYITLIIDRELSVFELQKAINVLVGNHKICFFDKLNDCWIKKI